MKNKHDSYGGLWVGILIMILLFGVMYVWITKPLP